MRAFGIAAVLMLAGAVAAEAGEWRGVSIGGDSVVLYDVASHRRSGSSVTVWTLSVVKEPRLLIGTTKRYDYFLARRTFDCDRSVWSENQIVYYSLSDVNALLSEMVDDPPTGVVPDSNGALLFDAVCGEQIGTYTNYAADEVVRLIRDDWPSDRP